MTDVNVSFWVASSSSDRVTYGEQQIPATVSSLFSGAPFASLKVSLPVDAEKKHPGVPSGSLTRSKLVYACFKSATALSHAVAVVMWM